MSLYVVICLLSYFIKINVMHCHYKTIAILKFANVNHPINRFSLAFWHNVNQAHSQPLFRVKAFKNGPEIIMPKADHQAPRQSAANSADRAK